MRTSCLARPGDARSSATVTPTPTVLGQTRFDDLVGSLDAIVWEADGDDYRMTFVSPRRATSPDTHRTCG